MTPRAEELWSYLIGLAPLGSPVKVDARLMADLGIPSRPALYHHINVLEADDCIKRVAPCVFVVTKRIGAFGPTKPRARQATEDFAAFRRTALERLAEIPRFDRRDLTGRICGDPYPERSAAAQKRRAKIEAVA